MNCLPSWCQATEWIAWKKATNGRERVRRGGEGGGVKGHVSRWPQPYSKCEDIVYSVRQIHSGMLGSYTEKLSEA